MKTLKIIIYKQIFAINSGAYAIAAEFLSGNSHMRIGAKPTGNSAGTGVNWRLKM
jgi:hypothetical protein